jgi:hypothetical protein
VERLRIEAHLFDSPERVVFPFEVEFDGFHRDGVVLRIGQGLFDKVVAQSKNDFRRLDRLIQWTRPAGLRTFPSTAPA